MAPDKKIMSPAGGLGHKGIGMRSEFQYFMNQDDHAAFDNHLLSIDGVSLKQGKLFDEILFDDGLLQRQFRKANSSSS